MSRYSGGINQGGGGGGGGGGVTWSSFTDTTDTPKTYAQLSANIERVTSGSGGHTSSLPAISGTDIGSRVEVTFRVVGIPVPGDSLTVDTADAATIDGAASVSIAFAGGTVFYVKSATEWIVESGLAG